MESFLFVGAAAEYLKPVARIRNETVIFKKKMMKYVVLSTDLFQIQSVVNSSR